MDLAAWVQTKTSGHWFACHNNNTTQFKVAELLEDFFCYRSHISGKKLLDLSNFSSFQSNNILVAPVLLAYHFRVQLAMAVSRLPN